MYGDQTARAQTGLTGDWFVTSDYGGDVFVNREGTALPGRYEHYKSSDLARSFRRNTSDAFFSDIEAGDSFYYSAVFRATSLDSDNELMVVLQNDSDGHSSDLVFGIAGSEFLIGDAGGTGPTSGDNTTAGTVQADTDHRLIVKFTLDVDGNTDRLDAWVDVNSESDAKLIDNFQASLVRGQFTSAGDASERGISGIEGFGENLGDFQTGFIDDIRVGTTFGDVVPEPATMSLLAIGGLGVLIRRRRA